MVVIYRLTINHDIRIELDARTKVSAYKKLLHMCPGASKEWEEVK